MSATGAITPFPASSPRPMRTVTAAVAIGRGGRSATPGAAASREGAAAAQAGSVTPGRVPRIARLMALAIRMEGLLQSGTVRTQRDLADLAHVTPARLSQILNLLHLAPDIQEALLFLPAVHRGRDPVTERAMRPVASVQSWSQQRACSAVRLLFAKAQSSVGDRQDGERQFAITRIGTATPERRYNNTPRSPKDG